MSNFSVSDIKVIALAEMNKWGLVDLGWKFAIDEGKTRHGQCSPSKRLLTLTRTSLIYNPDADVVDTIRHEIAHALHFEWCEDNNIDYSEKVFKWSRNGGRYVRKIPPHGKQWKRFAVMVGATPKASSKGHAPAKIKNWRAVVIRNGTVSDTGAGCRSFLPNMHRRTVTGVHGSKGNLYLVNGAEWSQVVDGNMDVNSLIFYQKQGVPTNFGTLVLK